MKFGSSVLFGDIPPRLPRDFALSLLSSHRAISGCSRVPLAVITLSDKNTLRARYGSIVAITRIQMGVTHSGQVTNAATDTGAATCELETVDNCQLLVAEIKR